MDNSPSIADWIVAVASVVTTGAVVLQFMMWKQAKRQNDLLSRPRLRLKPKDSLVNEPEAKSSSRVITRRTALSIHPLYNEAAELEWESHVQATAANLGVIPNRQIGFVVENIGGVLATALKLKVAITISGNPADQNVQPKLYQQDYFIEVDIRPGQRIFVPLLRTRLIFSAEIIGHITMVQDSLGTEETFKEKNQQTATCLFSNELLQNALSTQA